MRIAGYSHDSIDQDVDVGRWFLQRIRLLGPNGRRGSCEKSLQQNVHSVIQLWRRVGTWLMGKVASDKCHKWVFKEPTENEPNVSNYWQSSFDALPSEWTDQFESGIQTIAVIQAGHGLLQLGSCKIIAEDLHFVLRMRHTFESLGYQSGYYLSQLFSSTRTTSPSSTFPLKQQINMPIRPPPVFNWGSRPIPSATSLHAYPNFQNSAMIGGISHSSEAQTMENHHENDDIKWPNGLTIFSALTGQSDDSRLLFNPDSLSSKSEHNQHAMNHDEKTSNPTSDSSNQNEFLSLESHFG
ncbi:protein RICE SALT SENSITIVE 3-like isoform X2 [Nicotiana sylvestris]|uniref:protein RICE SALT SENSITIVE 3-like isoform X2 n=1 Tax=Nicotiana sylvestris TaxID=4096 RepID=UPI00388C5CE2